MQTHSFELGAKLGYQSLKALVYYEGRNSVATARVEPSNVKPKLQYTIKTHTHMIMASLQKA
jgi:hypothetical protein